MIFFMKNKILSGQYNDWHNLIKMILDVNHMIDYIIINN